MYMSIQSEHVKKWRDNYKKRVVASLGGKCVCCGYDKCMSAMDIHHLDPNKKDFSFGRIRANPTAWPVIVEELRKCVLLCAICHREYHAGVRILPENPTMFDERYVNYKDLYSEDQYDSCPVCGEKKKTIYQTCSKKCAFNHNKISWELFDLRDLYEVKKLSCNDIANIIKCSSASVAKKLRKEGIFVKENKLQIKICPCGKEFKNSRTQFCSTECYHKFKKHSKLNRPPKEVLEKEVWEISTINLCKKYQVSDVAIAKWCKSYGISKPARGYWNKKNAILLNKEEVERLLSKHGSLAGVAKELKISVKTVSRFCDTNNIEKPLKPSPKVPRPKREEFEEMVAKMYAKDLAKHYNCSVATIKTWKILYKTTPKTRFEHAETLEQLSPPANIELNVQAFDA